VGQISAFLEPLDQIYSQGKQQEGIPKEGVGGIVVGYDRSC